jgi:predicted CoA-binding protein
MEGVYPQAASAFRPQRHVQAAYAPGMATVALDDTIRELLSTPRTWAVVGCSPSPHRDSHRIAALLQRRGNRIIPVNPTVAGEEILGEGCAASLADLPPGSVDVVDIFRRADAAGAHVDEAIAIGARAVWMQLGVIDADAAERGRAAGLAVVMDRCPAIEVRRLGLA